MQSPVKRLRVEKGLTRREFAKNVDISLSYLVHIERGFRKPPIKTLARLAKELGVPIGQLKIN